MMCSLFALSCASARIENPLPPEALQGISRICIERTESRDFAGVERIPYLQVPREIMNQLGIEVVSCDDSDYRIKVFTTSRPIGATYSSMDGSGSFYKYTGAETSGRLRVDLAGQPAMILRFQHLREPSRIAFRDDGVLGGYEEKDAPFASTFSPTGAYYDAWISLLWNRVPEESFVSLVQVQDRYWQAAILRFIDKKDIRSSAPYLLRQLETPLPSSDQARLLLRWNDERVLQPLHKLMPRINMIQDYKMVFVAMKAFKHFKKVESVPHILRFMERMDQRYPKKTYDGRVEAIEALKAISGKDLGSDLNLWQKWAAENNLWSP